MLALILPTEKNVQDDPIETTVLRSWENCVVICWWDTGNEWFNIRVFKHDDGKPTEDKTIRLSKTEIERLKKTLP